MSTDNPISALQEFTTSICLAPPKYELVTQTTGTHKNQFEFIVSVAGVQASGKGFSKQLAKHQAAKNALIKIDEEGNHVSVKTYLNKSNLSITSDGDVPDPDCIVDLQNLCMEKSLQLPSYFEISGEGPSHCREFTYGCSVASLYVKAKAGTKKLAKRLAAKEMLEKLKSLSDEELNSKRQKYEEIENLQAKEKYQLLNNRPDCNFKEIGDFNDNPFVKMMALKGLKYEDFAEDLKMRNEEALSRITGKLGIAYTLRQNENQPTMATLNVAVQVPFAQIAIGDSYDDAKQKVLHQAFLILESYINKKEFS
ncbi:interferon-inducible double-stranded RNA-dependent protein kinase activator A homolog [Anthonomus grandis grandis]|uniref:interferon-inducible double-stranded RNA-dependent protein kinase activator A homolog n=1 Tax=Anthonomus grandis grandis TaxID=2921223 RepID=UPI0021650E9E|nr:interferon-inducible double-stranded RNA-dependent protein kinase activator A homolog [Anthonomus grandis grandis]XP_050302807.1 interferon-inducible double-stranded RNA-dependent protein kinase activator A homolog [Anthonomus grandis grandis]